MTAAQITLRLGATWIPNDIINEFMYQLLKTKHTNYVKAQYSEITGSWTIENKNWDSWSVYAKTTYGTSRINAYDLLENALNLKDTVIRDPVQENGKTKYVVNEKETRLAQGKQKQIQQAFDNWIFSEPNRRKRIEDVYNKKFNSCVHRKYDGSHLFFDGMNCNITLRPHQKDAVARCLYGGNTLLAHSVGAGKTYEMCATVMEAKRIGLCHKSMIVVPNNIVAQFATEFMELYPNANILVATEKDFTKENRKKFCSRIATNDYDAVIIGQSQFEKIPLNKETKIQMMNNQLEELIQGIQEAKKEGNNHITVKALEATRKSLENNLKKLNDIEQDDVVTFEQLGVDKLFVDEAHNYKNLFLYTKMSNVAGINTTQAKKSSDLFDKVRWLDEKTNSKGTVFATGTPVSNTMAELYTMQRYLQYDRLKELGLVHFDAWASTFGQTTTELELKPEGTGFRMKKRFSKFYNIPELMSVFREVADIQTKDMLTALYEQGCKLIDGTIKKEPPTLTTVAKSKTQNISKTEKAATEVAECFKFFGLNKTPSVQELKNAYTDFIKNNDKTGGSNIVDNMYNAAVDLIDKPNKDGLKFCYEFFGFKGTPTKSELENAYKNYIGDSLDVPSIAKSVYENALEYMQKSESVRQTLQAKQELHNLHNSDGSTAKDITKQLNKTEQNII